MKACACTWTGVLRFCPIAYTPKGTPAGLREIQISSGLLEIARGPTCCPDEHHDSWKTFGFLGAVVHPYLWDELNA